jgi:hypothetical protein
MYTGIRGIFLELALGALLVSGCQGEERKGAEAEDYALEEEDHAHEAGYREERITLSEAALQTVSFKTVTVQQRSLEQEVRATAVVQPNEYRLAHVTNCCQGPGVELSPCR